MTVWYTSDLHFAHQRVAEIREFDSAVAHDRVIRQRWENRVDPRDIVWVLGDISSGSSSGWEYALETLGQLPGRKRLVNGNHDPCSSIHRDAWRYQQDALEVFESVQDFARTRITLHGGRHDLLMSHYPYLGAGADHTAKPRYSQYRLRDEGRWLLHGHTHMKGQRLHGRQIHVGLDAWGLAPVSHETIRTLAQAPIKGDLP